ncbi:MAG TPA: LuxR C-terminal-related transcriptional regulator [Gaiellaceae bacterium]|jgi:DNA-binding CsgD family transcriptional regulator|nr:LuxR C-terminal-related transcriptional regulator [Gaiellaceae bacterium]
MVSRELLRRRLRIGSADVLRLLADGLSNDEIGKKLFISAETVRTHVRKAMDKLDADTRTQAVARALRDLWNLVAAQPEPGCCLA